MATFGDDSAGTTSAKFAADELQLRKFTAFPGGNVSAMAVCAAYMNEDNAPFRCAVFAADGEDDAPSTLLWVSAEFLITSQQHSSPGFRTVEKYGGGSTQIAAQDLWLACWVGGSVYLYDGGSGATGLWTQLTYSSSGDPSMPGWADDYGIPLGIYLTYTAAAGIAPHCDHYMRRRVA